MLNNRTTEFATQIADIGVKYCNIGNFWCA